MKVTVYTIKDCAFSKQEKEYLNANKIAYEEKDLEINKEFLTEMLAISNNFAGTPVTRVEKDDGTIAVLKGFTKEEFDNTFGFTSPASVTSAEAGTMPIPPTNDTPITPSITPEPVSPAPAPTPTIETQAAPPPVETPITQQPPVNDPLKSVMDNLQTKSEAVAPPVQPTVTDSTNSAAPPPIIPIDPTPVAPPVPEPVKPTSPAVGLPEAGPTDAPSIPDFPAK